MRILLIAVSFCAISFTALLAQDSIVTKFAARSHTVRAGFFLSTNNGTSWSAAYQGLPANCSVLACVVSGTYLFAGTDGSGIFRSADNGTSWIAADSGLTNTDVRAFAVSGSNLFAGTNGGGAFRSTDSGATWTAASGGLTDTYVRALAISDTNLFVGTAGFGGGVFRSTDNGASWNAASGGITNKHIYALALDGTNLFAGTYGGGIFRSTDNGTSWSPASTDLTNGYVNVLAVGNAALFAGTSGGVFRSTNNGTSWTAADAGLPNGNIYALAFSGGNLFAGANGAGVFLSTDDGTNWTAANTGVQYRYVYALAISGTKLFAGTDKGPTLPYRLFIPDSYSPLQRYPLVLALHGSGERGTDNASQMKGRLATSWAGAINQAKYPCFVVAPQCPLNEYWTDDPIVAAEIDLLDSLTREFTIDTTRLYITGLSMGGFGTWDMITRFPGRFAAAIPMSGGGNPALVSNIAKTPIWDFHGALDTDVPVQFSRDMIAALEGIGRTVVYTHCQNNDCSGLPVDTIARYVASHADLFYTEYQYGTHAIWDESYDYPFLFPWVFDKHLVAPTSIAERTDELPRHFVLEQNYPNPFNPTTVVSCQLPVASEVRLVVHDILGREVAVLLNERKNPGTYEVTFDGSRLASGVYFYRLTAGSYVETKKLILLR